MSRGELLTRLTIWLALCGYAIGAGAQLAARRRPRRLACARLVWTLGCGFFLAHVASAFSYYHHWSHAAAYQETAVRTEQLTGVRSGGGIYLNYLMALMWVADVVWWWLSPHGFSKRPYWLSAIWQGFFIFMVFNGTVVFGTGPVRWLGVVICAGLVALLWRQWTERTAPYPPVK